MKEINYKDMKFNPFNLIGGEWMLVTAGEVLEPIKVLRADIDYNKHLNNARSASRRVTLARQELCPHGDGTVAGGFRGSRSSCGISRSSQAWRLSDSYYLQNN